MVDENLQALCGSGPVHNDNLPLLEFAAPKQMYTNDTTLAANIWSKRWLSPETRKILQEIESVEHQIAFTTLTLSLYRPFYNMVDLLNATSLQKKRFFDIMENYCACSLIRDYSILADQELKEKCLAAQINTLEKTIHLISDKTTAYNHLGYVYYVKRDFSQAIECYQKVLAINSESITAHTNLGNIYAKSGRLDEAIFEYKKTLTINPNFAEAHYNLALAYENKNMLEEAIRAYKKAIATRPDHVKAYTKLGTAYIKKGRLAEAITVFERALAINPNDAHAHKNLALAYYSKGNYKLAVIHCDKAIAQGSKIHPQFLSSLEPYR